MAKEIRVTFTDKEVDLYNFINSKSSKTGFLKDLANLEKERQEKLINSSDVDYETLASILASKLGNVTLKVDSVNEDLGEDLDEETIINNTDFSDLDL